MANAEPPPITAISVKGFKSFAEEQKLEIRPLTLLAGANSSGKSSALQPLLLLKQTLEASYDPGPLLLSGPNARFTSARQVLTRLGIRNVARQFEIYIEVEDRRSLREIFRRNSSDSFDLVQMTIDSKSGEAPIHLEPGLPIERLIALLPSLGMTKDWGFTWKVGRTRCFLGIQTEGLAAPLFLDPTKVFSQVLRSVIHVPGLRGNPARTYETAAVENDFPGTFERYVASVVAHWQREGDERLASLKSNLDRLALTSTIQARPIDAAQVELLVGRMPTLWRSKESDLVDVADVGFGVSQVLPVLVALLAARQGQLVYIEQPEIHLHPKAQEALASVLAEAAGRGVRVVAETHSSTLLLAVQTLVAEGKLSPDKVKLHWFQRDERGATRVHSANLDEHGAYGDWPEDFGQAEARAESRYLDAVETKVFGPKKRAKKS